MIGNPLETQGMVPEMRRGVIRVAKDVAARRRMLACAISDVLEAWR